MTGGSRGIGRAVALRLAADGMPVIVNYKSNTAAAEETKAAIEAAGGVCELLPFDTADPKAIEAAMEQWEARHADDYIATLVNNAGIRLDTTLNGFFYLTRRVVKGMMTKRYGRIVNVVSLSGIKGMPGQTNYSAAKAAVIGATKALAQEVAPRKVTVNAVAPGFVATDMTKDLDEGELKKLIPAGRFGKPEEVAALVAFLASKEAAYITGEVVNINGGLYT